MRRMALIASITALVTALVLPGAAAGKKDKGPKMPVGVATEVAAAVLEAKRKLDPNTIAGEVDPCIRRGRRKFTCDSARTVDAQPQDQLCTWVTTVIGSKKFKVNAKISPEQCGPAPPPQARG